MDAHTILLLIAIVCELAACFFAFRPDPQPRAASAIALGLVFFFISLLIGH
jgi:hypothetical protein